MRVFLLILAVVVLLVSVFWLADAAAQDGATLEAFDSGTARGWDLFCFGGPLGLVLAVLASRID